jgi:NAD(P)-dependent dehydrogenase (short-subunit alcohol dehydrogenase family)
LKNAGRIIFAIGYANTDCEFVQVSAGYMLIKLSFNSVFIIGLLPYEFSPVYAASKHGVVGFTRSVAQVIFYFMYKA